MILQGKTALITGTNRGIGKAMVSVFAREGANVLAHARQPHAAFDLFLQEAAAANGVSVRPLYFDMSDSVGMKQAMLTLASEKLPVDILVNNAGIVGENRLFQMTPLSDIRKVFENNFFSMMALTQYVIRFMCKQKSGVIVNIASVAALDGDPAQLEYAASKAAVIGATKKLALELAPHGIRVNTLAPGLTKTNMIGHMSAPLLQKTLSRVALGRMANSEEIAGSAAFLASDLSSFITGQVLRVDGGM